LPGIPSLSNTRTGNNVTISWGAVTGATQYQLYKAVGTGSFSVIATITAPSASASNGLSGSNGTVNKYYVIAVNTCGQGPASSTLSITK
jgi:hypothetical protein